MAEARTQCVPEVPKLVPRHPPDQHTKQKVQGIRGRLFRKSQTRNLDFSVITQLRKTVIIVPVLRGVQSTLLCLDTNCCCELQARR